MKFNWEEFMDRNNKIAVHCKTKEEAIDFCKQMHKHGMKWQTGKSYINNDEWYYYKEKTCYSNKGEFTSKVLYEDCGYKILEWSDYMIEGPINYLEYGYVVEFENGELAMYMPSQQGDGFSFGNQISCLFIKDFNNNLQYTDKNFNKYDIKKIYGYAKYCYMTTLVNVNDRPLIWERPKEVKKMTVTEICKELGYKVEIIAEEK